MKITKVIPKTTTLGNSNYIVKNTSKMILPTTTTLGVLAGSSLNGQNVPPDAPPHEPGTSVEDSILEQIKHTGKMATDAGEEIVNGAKGILDSIFDWLDDIF